MCLHAQRLRAPCQHRLIEHASSRVTGPRRHDVARVIAQSLAVFENAKLLADTDQHVRIGADPDRAASGGEISREKHAVAQIRFGDGAQADDCPAAHDLSDLTPRRMRGVHEAPASIHRHVSKQPFDRSRAQRRLALLYLAQLLSDVNVDGPLARKRQNGAQLQRCDGSETVWSDAYDGIRHSRRRTSAGFDELCESVEVRYEAGLLRTRWQAVKPAMRVEHRKQRQTDARLAGCGGDTLCHLGRVRVGASRLVVMDVVKLTDPSESRFQHLDIGLSRESFEIVRGQPRHESIHQLAPAPEAVAGVPAALGQSGHTALERVAVKVRDSRQSYRCPFIVGQGLDATLHQRDAAFLMLNAYALDPSPRQQGCLEVQGGMTRGRSHSTDAGQGFMACDMYRHYRCGRQEHLPMQCDRIWHHARLATCAAGQPDIGAVADGLVAARDGRILFAGPAAEAPASLDARESFDCEGRWITPGLIDCHTHLVYGGDRAHEFEQRLAGVSYEAIARAGGGIVSTMNATRAASEAELVRTALPRLDALLAEGVTTLEIKSGYGLSLEHERKQLLAARALGRARNVSITTTFLGAHALPPEFAGNPDGYVDEVCESMLPAIAREGLADAVDAFCESIGFTAAQTRRLFEAAKRNGLPVKLHAEQLSNQRGAALAAEFGALSADHLEHLDDAGVAAMARAGTVAVLLPGAFYFVRETKLPPLGALREQRIPIALATDSNPGTSPLTSLLLVMNMAATLFRMTVDECLIGVTRAAAMALGQSAHIGTLESGKWCDLAIWNIDRPAELVYRMGFNPLHARIWRGH